MAIHADPGPTGVRTDERECPVELAVISCEIGGEVRRLVRQPRAPTLVQIQSVEGDAATDEVVRQLGIEEVIGVAVRREDGVLARSAVTPSDQRGHQLALAIGIQAEWNGLLRVARQYVGLPRGHASYLSGP